MIYNSESIYLCTVGIYEENRNVVEIKVCNIFEVIICGGVPCVMESERFRHLTNVQRKCVQRRCQDLRPELDLSDIEDEEDSDESY
ncbi:Uncharacterised protein g6508 [Pycnogonum litorale]